MNIPTAEALLPVATSIVNTMGTILTNMLGKTSPPLNDSVDLVRIHKYKILCKNCTCYHSIRIPYSMYMYG